MNPNGIERKHGRYEGEYCEADVGFQTLGYPFSISLDVLDFPSLWPPISTPQSVRGRSGLSRKDQEDARKHRHREISRIRATHGA
jgi:hypothetical protein